jgi:hypothetical protein
MTHNASPFVYHPFSKGFVLTPTMLIWLRDYAPDSQFGLVNGHKQGIYMYPEDWLAFRLKFGLYEIS